MGKTADDTARTVSSHHELNVHTMIGAYYLWQQSKHRSEKRFHTQSIPEGSELIKNKQQR